MRKQIPIRLPEKVYEDLRLYASERHVSMNQVITIVLSDFLEDRAIKEKYAVS